MKRAPFSVQLLAPNDGAGSGDGGAGGAPPKVEPPKIDESAKALKAAQDTIAALQKQIDDRQRADADADEKRKTKLKEDGDLKKLLEERELDLQKLKSKLDELDPDAKLGRSFRERETARVEAEKRSLPEEQQKLIDAQPSVDLKAQLLDVFKKATAAATPQKGKATAAGGSPPAAGTTDWSSIRTRDELDAAKNADPGGFANLVTGLFGGKKRATSLDLLGKRNGS